LKARGRPTLAAVVTAALCALCFFAGFLAGYGGGFSSGWGSSAGHVWDEAYGSGYLAGWAAGNSTGFSEGYEVGRSEGYKSGYIQGARDASAAGGFTLRNPVYDEVAHSQNGMATSPAHPIFSFTFKLSVISN